jgi:hypothetical protein
MAAKNRKSQIATELAPVQGPVPTSRLGDEIADEERVPRFVVHVSRDGENTVAMSAEERRNEDG